MLRFPFIAVPIAGAIPPSLPANTVSQWRPLVPVRVHSPCGRHLYFPRALVDSGADVTVFPLGAARAIGISTRASGHRIRWRGQASSIEFATVELEFSDSSQARWRWPATIAFSAAPVRYPILGTAGCLQYFDVTLRGFDRIIELETNRSYPGTIP